VDDGKREVEEGEGAWAARVLILVPHWP